MDLRNPYKNRRLSARIQVPFQEQDAGSYKEVERIVVPEQAIEACFRVGDAVRGHYLGGMKSRITLTMDSKRIAKLRTASRKRRMSVAALVEELTDGLDNKVAKNDADWVAGLKGAITGRITKEEIAADPRLAAILGK